MFFFLFPPLKLLAALSYTRPLFFGVCLFGTTVFLHTAFLVNDYRFPFFCGAEIAEYFWS